MDLSNTGSQAPIENNQEQQPAPQANDVIVDNPAFKEAEQKAEESNPVAEPTQQYNDPYANQSVSTVRQSFEKYLEEKYPIKGKLDINKIDKEDPNALSQFFNDIQENTASDLRNEQMRQQAYAEFEEQVFQPVYDAFPNLRKDPVTDTMVKAFYRGVSAENPNVSPVKVVASFSNFVKGVYNQGVQSGRSSVQNIPTPPVGNQGRASKQILNTDVVEKMASGDVSQVADLVSALQGKGVGGL